MPGMRVFGRRCALATDDFFFIGTISSVIFLPCLAYITVIYVHYLQDRNSCEKASSIYLTDVSLPFLCTLFFSNCLIAFLFAIFSMKGTILKPEPRRHVVTLVYIKLFISVLDVACAILGTVILVENSFCASAIEIGLPLVIKLATTFQWIATLVRILMIVIFYDWNSSQNTKVRIQSKYFTNTVRRGTLKRWSFRFQALFLWCTTPSQERNEAIKLVSEAIAVIANISEIPVLQNILLNSLLNKNQDLDLVASDVIAGLLLYRQKCLRRWKREKEALNAAPPIMQSDGTTLVHFPPDNLPEWMNLQLAKRYLNVGLGVFAWKWYIYRNISCGCCHLINRLICCFHYRRFATNVLGDNCCGCSLAGLQAITSLPYEDLVHVSFVDKVFEVPFFVTFDHETKAIVVTARGTMSVDDVLTDVAAGFADMDDPGCPPGALCHHGMLSAAREIKKKLDEKEILVNAFQERPDYKLVLTGYSLGASVASVLTLLLKPSYPDVRCYAFGPYPSINKATLESTFDSILTVVYGNDTVAYLSYENVKNMVLEVMKYLEECDLPKFKVFLNFGRHHEVTNSDENGCSERSVVNGNGKKSGLENHIYVEESDVEAIASVPYVTESLYVAGTIVHIRQAEDGFRLKISTADEYKPLSFRPNMIFHHFPQNIQACLEKLDMTQVVDRKSFFNPLD